MHDRQLSCPYKKLTLDHSPTANHHTVVRAHVAMDLENLSAILPPASLIEAGVPTASIASLSEGMLSTHVITSGSETENTLYQACSISKTITALAVAKLIDQGHLTYATKVADHLPQNTIDLIADDKTKHIFSHVTVGHLLSHTSGLSQHGFPGYDERDGFPTASDVLAGRPPANTPRIHFASLPGAQFSYSGGGFMVLQLFLEALLKKPFTSIMRETVLERLDMSRSFFGPLPDDEADYSTPYLTGHLKAPSGPYRFIELAAAGLWTTPSDLVKAIAAVQNSLDSPKGGFLTNQTAQHMLQPVHHVSGATYIAHGWFVTDVAFGHSGGNDPGYCCYALGFRPDRRFGKRELSKAPPRGALAVMTNAPYSNQSVWRVVSAVFYLQNWPRLASLPGGMVDGQWRAVAVPGGSTTSESWKEWIGVWQDGWRITTSLDNRPAISFGGLEAVPLVPAATPMSPEDGGGDVIGLVLEGLEAQITLTWEGDERVVKLLQKDLKTLHRVAE